jgi:hypothetical protein
VVVDDTLDVALLLEEGNGAAGERAVDLHAVNEDRLRDELVGRDLLEDAVAGKVSERSGGIGDRRWSPQRSPLRPPWRYSLGLLVEDDGVVGLVLNLALGPLLLLAVGCQKCFMWVVCGASARRQRQ